MSDLRLRSRAFPESSDDRIMISGASGKFPNSDNVAEFADNLYNNVDMTDEDERRWKHIYSEIPKRSGKINHLEKFDAMFFGIHFKQAHTMDPQSRLLVEKAYECVVDAGINPKNLRGSRTGVFIGSCFAESEKTWFYEKISTGGFGITGCSRAMMANRISFSLGLQGPSLLADTACSSSMTALDLAFSALRNGECDAAIVGGSNLLLHPYVTFQFARLGVLSLKGGCRPFDQNAAGYVRAEAISCIFLQKYKDCKRAYCEVVYSKTNCDGYKEQGITYPSGGVQQRLLKEFYEDIKMHPKEVAFVEAHSTGTVVGDPEECAALDAVFCSGRSGPLLVGSVKSNIGHSESASGLCSLVKVILAMESNLIPANINFEAIRAEVPSLKEGRLQVVSQNTPLPGSLIGVNSFGFGGANAHCLLKTHSKEKVNGGRPCDDMPRLVHWSGRTEGAVNAILDAVSKKPLDVEFIGLLHSLQAETITANLYRGYGVYALQEDGTTACLKREAQHFTGVKRPIVWVFSGMGSQWTEMGASLMKIPIFRESIEKSQKVMAPYGLNVIEILTSPTNAFDNILHSFVGIAAIQIALVDVLKTLDLEPDYFIGHSVGELGCAYADGCFTAEQMIVAAYCRGKASLETKKIFGSMAAVGLGYQKIKSMLPNTIEAACHNGPDSCTISGPAEEVEAFVANLKAKGIFAKEVPCSNIAYHSRYIADMGPKLQKMLENIIPEPKKRSPKWLSTSVPKQRWDETDAQYSSAKYHTHNLLNYVLFEETTALLPPNAITVEVAPHGLLQAILKKSMPNAIHVGLTQRGNKDNTQFLLASLGKLFIHGIDMPIDKLYPPIEFPVSRGTPMISPYIQWDHSEDWFVARFEQTRMLKSGERRVKVSLKSEEFEYIAGHMIDGRCLFPATGYLHLVMETFGMMAGDVAILDVEFSDVRFLRATNLTKDIEIEFVIMIQSGTGRFEITENSTAVVTGYIRNLELSEPLTEITKVPTTKFPTMEAKDFYKELRLRGYHYNGLFRGVESARGDGLIGRVKHNINWVPFLDCLMQIHIVGYDLRSLMLPTRLQRLRINSQMHAKMVSEEDPYFDVAVSKELNIIRAGGVEIVGLHASPVSRRRPPGIPILESYQFIPHLPAPKLSKMDAIRVAMQLALENNWTHKVKAIEVDTIGNEPIISVIQEALADLPLISPDLMYLSPQELEINGVHVENGKLSTQTNCMFVIATHCLADSEFIEKSIPSLAENSYLISREPANIHVADIKVPSEFLLLMVLPTNDETIVMCQRNRRKIPAIPKIIAIKEDDKEYGWLEELKVAMKSGPVTIISQNEPLSGMIGLVNCLRREPEGYLINCVFIDDHKAPAFNPEHPYYKSQMKLDLAVNVNRNGIWGSYRHLKLPSDTVLQRTSEHCFANSLLRGDLSSIVWLNGGLSSRFFNEPGFVRIVYAALNFRDVMLASGKLAVEVMGSTRLEQECVMGLEYSGYNNRGQRVMGMVNCGALATHVISQPEVTFLVPDKWTLEEAASVPVVYLTVYIAFFFTANIQKGKKILIHAGTGGIGMAAIRTALIYGLDVYTTVSTEEKKAFLLKTFPELKKDQIGNSRNTSFEQMVKMHTKGKGVDYVLNSLAEEKLHASIRCLGIGGQFLEIGKFDLSNDTKIGLGNFLKEISFHSVLADNLFRSSTEPQEKEGLFELIQRDLDRGIIQPLPTQIFMASEIEKAFRFLASGKHMGKVIVKMRDNDLDNVTCPVPIKARVNCDYDMSYVIPGGLGGFGLELADWLVIRGARKLVLSSSRGITKPYQAYRIRMWESYGAKVVISTSDITTREGCEQLLREANKIGPVAGIFNLAVVLRDSILENQTVQKFQESLAPKAFATKYFDEVSRKLCPNLKHFVVFSSVSCGRGNAGQSNYGMANSIMERIIEKRTEEGLPGKAIQWGAVGEVGLVADMQEVKLDMEIGGTLQQRISSCLQELDPLLLSPQPIVASMVVAEKRVGGDGKGDILATVMNIMGVRDIKSISMDASLSELGMDSLMAVEIKQTLEREFEIFLSPQDLRSLTFQKLQELAESREKGQEQVKLKLANEDRPVGMAMLLRSLGDEATSEKPILRLSSKNDRDKYLSCALVIPGIEGIAGNAWHTLAASISLPTFVLQLSQSVECTTIEGIAKSLYDGVSALLKSTEYFYIVGYSFGSTVALELARLLEEEGRKGKVLLIDGSPKFLRSLAISQLTEDYNDEVVQCVILSGIIRQVFPEENSEDLFAKLMEIQNWMDRVNKLIEMSQQQHVYSEPFLRKSADALYKRLMALMCWTNSDIKRIHAPITLVRPTEVSVVDIEEDYGLSNYTDGGVTLKFIEGNHISMLENSKLSQIINDLDPELESDKVFEKYITVQ